MERTPLLVRRRAGVHKAGVAMILVVRGVRFIRIWDYELDYDNDNRWAEWLA
jgi:hypothetical protein